MKRLKNIEGKNKEQLDEIEYQGERQLDAIKEQGRKNLEAINKQEKVLKNIKNQNKVLIEEIEKKEKSEKVVLLEDNLNDILLHYDMNISLKGKDILKKLASGEKMINYKNLFFKTGNLAVSNYDFLKRFGTLYDLLVELLNEEISNTKAATECVTR